MDSQTSGEAKRVVFVRLSPEQAKRLAGDALILQKSAPEAMRDVYFERDAVRPLLNQADKHELLVALGRIGNNMNQIAKRLNAGGQRGSCQQELASLMEDLAALRLFYMSKHCRCRERQAPDK